MKQLIVCTSLTLLLTLCTSCGAVAVKPNARPVVLESVEDVFEGPGDLVTLCGGLPAVFLIGSAEGADEFFATRTRLIETYGELAFVGLLDLGGLDELQRTEIQDMALEAALESDGTLLLDLDGRSANSLTGERPGLHLVHVNSGLLVAQDLDPLIATHEELDAFLSSKP